MNLINDFKNSNWQIWYPRESISPKFRKMEMNKDVQLVIASSGSFNNFGKWLCYVNGIQGRESYEFSVEYYPDNIKSENESIFAILSWMDIEGNMLQRDYADDGLNLEDGWKCFHRMIEAPPEACQLKVELGLRLSENGVVYWRKPAVIKGQPVLHRKVKVATTYIEPRGNFKANMEAMADIVEKAGKQHADLFRFSQCLRLG